MTLRFSRPAATRLGTLALVLGLGACSTIDSVTDSLFGPEEKARVPGERISLMPRGQDVIGQDPAYVGRGVAVPGPSPVTSWTQPGGNSQNLIGNTDASVNFGTLWSVGIGVGTSSDSAITASPVVGDGVIYTLDAAANVSAFDVQTGGLIWSVTLAPEDTSSDYFLFGSPGDAPEEGYGGGLAYSNGRVFVNTGFKEVVALDGRSGGRLWSKKVETPFHTAPTVRDGRVYTMNRDNKFWALDEATGAELWNHEVFGETASILASTSPAADSELVIVPYTNGDLYALRAVNGRPQWSDSLTRTGTADTLSSINDIAARPVIDGPYIYSISHAGRLVAIDSRSGERIWTRDIAGVQTPVVAGEYLYLSAMDGNVICLEKATGKVAWIRYLGRWQDEEDREDTVEWSGPLMAQGSLILVSTDGRMAILNASSGQLISTTDIGTGSIVAPITVGGTIFILNDDGILTAYR